MTRAFRKILMATDFGAESDLALRSAVLLARQLGSSLHLLHVATDPALAVHAPELAGIDWNMVRDDMVQHARHSLAALATSFPEVPIVTDVVIGAPAQAIAERAAEVGADLIVMGTHGRGGLRHAFLGSVAERVIRLADCPVMTVRASGATRLTAGQTTAAAAVGI